MLILYCYPQQWVQFQRMCRTAARLGWRAVGGEADATDAASTSAGYTLAPPTSTMSCLRSPGVTYTVHPLQPLAQWSSTPGPPQPPGPLPPASMAPMKQGAALGALGARAGAAASGAG